MKFMVHLVWFEREPGKLLRQRKERTFERDFPNSSVAVNQCQRDYKGCVEITTRPMLEQKVS
jgi:hypothetical protein